MSYSPLFEMNAKNQIRSLAWEVVSNAVLIGCMNGSLILWNYWSQKESVKPVDRLKSAITSIKPLYGTSPDSSQIKVLITTAKGEFWIFQMNTQTQQMDLLLKKIAHKPQLPQDQENFGSLGTTHARARPCLFPTANTTLQRQAR